jgi:hypothetical protein
MQYSMQYALMLVWTQCRVINDGCVNHVLSFLPRIICQTGLFSKMHVLISALRIGRIPKIAECAFEIAIILSL